MADGMLACGLFLAAPCHGQAGKAELFGTVLDPSGAVVPKAEISATHQATSAVFAVTSGGSGEYHLLGLPAGEYSLTARASGFVEFRQTGLGLRLGDQTSLDIKLTLAGADTIEVMAQAPLLQTASGSVSYAVDQAKLSTLPLDGRNFIPLIALAPGVALPSGSLLPRINGSRPRTNEYLYDGISILQPEPGQVVFYPILDSIEEFRLNINAYSPEYGRSNGGTVMVASKSGGNALHGTLFEYFRNEKLNARNLFAQPGPNPVFRRRASPWRAATRAMASQACARRAGSAVCNASFKNTSAAVLACSKSPSSR